MNKHSTPDYAGAISGGVFFISIGIILLLNTTGSLSWDVWGVLLRFWPILLITTGIQFILARNAWLSILAGMVNAFIIVAVCLFVVFGSMNGSNWLFANGETEQSTQSVKIEDSVEVESVKVAATVSVGSLTVSDEDNGKYVEVISKFPKGNSPTFSSSVNDKKLDVSFISNIENPINFFLTHLGSRWQHEMVLGAPKVPVELELTQSTGSAAINLSIQNIYRFIYSQSTGSLDAKFSGVSLPEEMRIDISTGSAIIDLPEDIRMDITYDVSLGSIKIFGEEFHGKGRFQKDSGDKELTMSLRVSTGSVEIL